MSRAFPSCSPDSANDAARMRLFCLPYAGASASVYRSWEPFLSSEVQLCPIELPGHGTRLQERPVVSMERLVRELTESLMPYLDRPFALLGHSMGAAIAMHLASALQDANAPLPVRLFVMGLLPLHVPRTKPFLHRLEESELIAAIDALGGTPQEVLDHPELMRLLLPGIRSDFELIETLPTRWSSPLPCGLSAGMGTEDERTDRRQMEQWQSYTRGDFLLRVFPGSHFFPWSCTEQVVRAIETDLGIKR